MVNNMQMNTVNANRVAPVAVKRRQYVKSGKTRKQRSNKGQKRLKPYVKKTTVRKQRSNKGKARGPRTGKTRSGKRFRGLNPVVVQNVSAQVPVKKVRKTRSNKGKKRGPRTGVTRSGKRFRG